MTVETVAPGCPRCGGVLGSDAQRCPLCGAPAPAPMDLVDPAYAGRRALALLVDLIPLVGLVIAGLLVQPPLRWYLLGAAGGWWVVLWGWLARTGQGPGSALAGIRVVDGRSGRVPVPAVALVRTVLRPLLVLGTLGIGGLSYRWDPAGLERTWWDRIAGTRVVTAAPLPTQLGWSDPVVRERWTPPPSASPPVPSRSAAPPPAPLPPIAPAPAAPPSAPMPSVAPPPAGPPSAPRSDVTEQHTVAIRPGPVTLTWDSGRSVLVNGHVLLGREPVGSAIERVDQLLAVDVEARGVSKTHLALDVTPLGITVTDRHSTNGVTIRHPDGTRIQVEPGKPTAVRDGDRVEFGGRWIALG